MIRFSTCKGSDFNENWFQESAYKLDILPWVSGINWINSIIYKHFSDFNPSRSEKILYYAGKDSDILLDALEVNNKFSIDKNIIIRGGGKPLELSYPKDKGNKYDIIIAANILGHLGGVDNFHEFIRQSYESLLAGGRAIFTFNFNLTSNDKTINGIDFYLPILKDIYNIASSLKETEVEINLRPGNTNWDDYNYEAGTAPTSPFIRTKFHDYINLPSVLVIDKVANRKIENKIFSKVKNLVNVFGNNVEMKSDKKSIYFLHIPKTAGTSTVKFIQKQYEPNEILAASIWTSLLTTFPKDIEQYKCTYGHFGYSFTNLFNDKDKFFVFTMLRDPVKRVFSHYNHMIRVKEGIHWLEKENGELYALDELILENKAQLFFNNVMTYQIAVSESIYSNIENVPVNQRHTARLRIYYIKILGLNQMKK